ncbi:MAG: PQQ-binding-like beta-propeller repeat protein [Bacteroidetes bacterium]|nr:PQQ-binding-like beta-propeller repeat protein [Bacteroidota bacterium]
MKFQHLVLYSIGSIIIPFASLAYTGEVVRSIKTPGNFGTGVTYDGKNLWVADRKDDKLYCIDPTDGKILASIPTPGYWPTGLAWDGQGLWNADIKGGIPLAENYNGKIYRLNPGNGNILTTIQSPSSTPRGLAWDGKYLWCVDSDAGEIIQFSPEDGTTIRSFKAPSGDPRGLAFDGKYIWVSDRMVDEIYMVDPEKGCVLLITEAPGEFITDLCFDGTYLWALDDQSNNLFQLIVNDDEKFVRMNERNARIIYTHLTTNFGPGTVLTEDVHLAIPISRDNQEIIGEPTCLPKYSDIITDKWGQKTAHYRFENISPGENREVVMTTEARIYQIRYFLFPDKIGTIDEIPADISALYLEDNEKYQIHHPVIQDAVKKVVGDEKNAYWIARKIFNYLIENMYYEMVGGWNTAPTVLARGNGSCSEYSFVYISMCRAAGLPARYVGAVVVRGDATAMDDVFHRWVEVYLPNYGWIPIDPSGGDQDTPRNQAMYIGNLSNRYLVTTQSGGGSETMGWTYNSNESFTTQPKTNVVIENFADWEIGE